MSYQGMQLSGPREAFNDQAGYATSCPICVLATGEVVSPGGNDVWGKLGP